MRHTLNRYRKRKDIQYYVGDFRLLQSIVHIAQPNKHLNFKKDTIFCK